SLIEPEELAGLACEEEISSRIVIEKDGKHPWQPIYGPMNEKIFKKLPKTHWTLLVNDVEKHVPQLASIVDAFRFIPEWRLDDLMISYAPEGGSVGPHLDQYDVFILQARGHRRWQISTKPVDPSNQVKDTPLRIQKNFKAEEEWILAPGDIIYIPPGVTHYGVALDDCMSYSIGFRAVTHSDMVNDFMGYITQNLESSRVYRDIDLQSQPQPNEITEDALQRVRSIFSEYLNPDHPELMRWFGRYMSDNKADIAPRTQKITSKQLSQLKTLYRHPASRFAFAKHNKQTLLFVDGEDFSVSSAFAKNLCKDREVNVASLMKSANETEQQLLVTFYTQGKLVKSL
ncbi:MAG TPA: cupin domain-containing protein, partial [Gammaproteobacteria bacterium]|nr:cupin domain-containing protein [Gammaproteobacteria bacterium]